jgi:hypothetical protein
MYSLQNAGKWIELIYTMELHWNIIRLRFEKGRSNNKLCYMAENDFDAHSYISKEMCPFRSVRENLYLFVTFADFFTDVEHQIWQADGIVYIHYICSLLWRKLGRCE